MNIVTGLCIAIIFLLSLLGWGRLTAIAAFGSAKGDWPFQAAWGVCALTILGGFLNVAGLVSAPANIAIVLLGVLLCLFFSQPRKLLARWRLLELPPQDRLAVVILALVSAVMIIGSVFPSPWNAADDSIGYAALSVKMLETGQLIEPFSLRRIVGFGGYAFLHSLVLAFSGPFALHVVDKGIMTALAGVSVAYYLRKRLNASWTIASTAGVILMVLPTGRINLSPTSIMPFLALALVETVHLASEMPYLPLLRRAGILAVVCGGFLALRANVLAVEGALLTLLIAAQRPFSLKVSAIREKVILLGSVGVISFLLLLPWAVSLYRSSGTPFFPVLPGNWTGAIPNSAPFHFGEYVRFLTQNIWYSRVLLLVIATLVAALVGASSVEVCCISAAAVITTIATISAGTLYNTYDLWRYYGPFTRLATVLVGTALFIHWRSALPGFIRQMKFGGVFLICLIALARPALSVAKKARQEFVERGRVETSEGLRRNDTQKAFVGLGDDYQASLACIAPYKAALATIPRGAKVLAQVDAPFLLDYRDHDIINIDMIGAVSPAPGMPIGKPPEDLAKYLSNLSIRYLIYTKPETSLRAYRRELWEKELPSAIAEEPFLRDVITTYLWYFDTVRVLSTQYPKAFESDYIVVLSLDSRLDAPAISAVTGESARNLPEFAAPGN